jgi:hypothetical protein
VLALRIQRTRRLCTPHTVTLGQRPPRSIGTRAGAAHKRSPQSWSQLMDIHRPDVSLIKDGEYAPSRRSTLGCRQSARAMAMRCFCPPLRHTPRSPTCYGSTALIRQEQQREAATWNRTTVGSYAVLRALR